MIRQESVIKNREVIGVLHVADWGVTFDPADNRTVFHEARLKTWETVEAAKAELIVLLKERGRQND